MHRWTVTDSTKEESRYKDDELEQYSRKKNVRISRIKEINEDTEDQLVEKVCQFAAAAGVTITDNDISTAHLAGACKKARQEQTNNCAIREQEEKKRS